MTRITFTILMLVVNLTMRGQDYGIQPGSPGFISNYADADFKGKFSLLIGSDAANNYFLLDFSRLPSRFERVYFMNLSFGENELINIDPDITKSRVCFMVNNKYSESEAIKIFEDIEKEVNHVSKSWTNEMKAEWLKENDKYKQHIGYEKRN